jgi:hypothetical protein
VGGGVTVGGKGEADGAVVSVGKAATVGGGVGVAVAAVQPAINATAIRRLKKPLPLITRISRIVFNIGIH